MIKKGLTTRLVRAKENLKLSHVGNTFNVEKNDTIWLNDCYSNLQRRCASGRSVELQVKQIIFTALNEVSLQLSDHYSALGFIDLAKLAFI